MKQLPAVVCLVVSAALSACGDFSCPMMSPLRSAKSSAIADLKKKAAEYETSLAKSDRPDRLGQIYYDLGQKYVEDGNWDQAIVSFEKSLEYGRKSAALQYYAGVSYANRGRELGKDEDIRRAEYHYRQAIGINPDYLDAHYGLAILVYYEKGDTALGTSMMEQVVARGGTYYRAHFALGKIYYEQGKPEKALSVYEALCSVLERKSDDSALIREYRRQCDENVRQLMKELSRS
ncbi:MAG: tetratricopeptide repeat protein [Spirochaetes bacterium]|jgi:tetratricopeptide (TPR) repeat protein|nr:tetratricopeptide repeat protein [Spirochaetota bacterium]